jgi:hypothetical protein
MQSLGAKSLSERRVASRIVTPNPRKNQGNTASMPTPATPLSPTNTLIKPRAKTASPAGTIPRATVDITRPVVREALVDQISLSAHHPLDKSCFRSVLQRKFNGICELASVWPYLTFPGRLAGLPEIMFMSLGALCHGMTKESRQIDSLTEKLNCEPGCAPNRL